MVDFVTARASGFAALQQRTRIALASILGLRSQVAVDLFPEVSKILVEVLVCWHGDALGEALEVSIEMRRLQ